MGLEQANATLTRILGAIEEYVYVGEFLPDDSYRVVFAGPCRERFLGMSIESASSAVWADYVHPYDVAIFDDAHEGAHKTGHLDAEYRIVGADGSVRWVRDRGRLRNEDGRRLLDGSVLDVTAIKTTREALEAARAEAQRAAQIDPLTGVANRRSLSPRLEAFGDRPIGVLSIDVDDFKNINDLFGHAAGDAVLVAVSAGLQEATREGDAIFRMGGEEFLVILADLCDDTALLDVAEAVRRRIETEPVPYAGERIELTASIGAARSDSLAGNIDSLLAAADRALYVAKRGGRNRVQLASPEDEHENRIVDGGFTLRLAQAMASVAAAADPSEQSHVTEVSQLAARIARRLGNPPPQILRCRLAGLLHNVGMVQVHANVSVTRSSARRSSPPSRTSARSHRSCASTARTSTGRASPTASPEMRSCSRLGSSPPRTHGAR